MTTLLQSIENDPLVASITISIVAAAMLAGSLVSMWRERLAPTLALAVMGIVLSALALFLAFVAATR